MRGRAQNRRIAHAGSSAQLGQRNNQRIVVHLSTARGSVFRGPVSAVEFAPASGVMQMDPRGTTYYGLVQTAEVTLRVGKRIRHFLAVNASIGVEQGRLTVIAELIHRSLLPPMNCANPDCICGDSYA